MDFLTDPWDFEFMRRALLAGIIVAVAASVVGTFVVLKGLAFLGDAVAHTQLAGAAVVLVAGGGTILITLGAAVAAVLTAVGVAALTRSGQIRQDTAIGIFFAGFFALGVLLISRQRNFALDLNSFLVGNILGVVDDDLIVMGVLAAVVLVVTVLFYTELRFVAYDPEMAAASGVPVGLVQTGLLVLVALAAVVAFRLVGVVLALAMLVAPAAAASLLARNIPRIMLGSIAFGVLSTVVGLYASFHADVAAGPAIVLSAVAIFSIAYVISPRGLRLRRGGGRHPVSTEQVPDEVPPSGQQ